jgi:hypothetical protein
LEAILLLCDAAQESGGKLYILGGGWTGVVAETPFNMALAILIAVPWDQTNRQVKTEIRLMTDDGDPVEVDGNVVQASLAFEVGRPPGTKPGAALSTPLTIAFNGLKLEAGGYRFELEIDGNPSATAPFRAQ